MAQQMAKVKALRRSHPKLDMAAGFIPGVGLVQGGQDMADSELAGWERGLSALNFLPMGKLAERGIIAGNKALSRAGAKRLSKYGGGHDQTDYVYEIPDYRAELGLGYGQRARRGDIKAPDVLRHPELFELYPELKNMDMMFLPDMKLGNAAFNPITRSIKYGPMPNNEYGRRVVLHELQHGVQDIEDLPLGIGSGKKTFEEYWRQPHEIEARLVEARSRLNPNELAHIPLDKNYDYLSNMAHTMPGLEYTSDDLRLIADLLRTWKTNK